MKVEPRIDCPRCFGTGICMPLVMSGAVPSQGMPCPTCLKASTGEPKA
jgi:hypothetical protein